MEYKALRQELEAIASCELGDVLDAWNAWTPDQAVRLRRYLSAEMGAHGLLSVEHGRENGSPMGAIRRDARRVLATL